MPMLIGGHWREALSGRTEEIASPFDGAVVGTMPQSPGPGFDILPDADLELTSSAVAAGGYANAGQVCISVQRVVAHPRISGDFLDALVPKVKAIRTGDPSTSETAMGTLISEAEAQRVRRAIAGAAAAGARILVGGERNGAMVTPAVVADVDPASPFSQEELFGPAVAVSTAADWESAIAQANGTRYGLPAGIFTAGRPWTAEP